MRRLWPYLREFLNLGLAVATFILILTFFVITA